MEKKMDIKQRTAYVTAIVAFIVGWGLTIWGFIVPPKGEISASVLTALGEAMVYAASVFGVAMYFGHQMQKFKADTRRYLEEKGWQNENDDADDAE